MQRHALALSLALVACSQSSLDGFRVPQEQHDSGVVYFVKNHGNDERNLDTVIAGAMTAMGFKATAEQPESFDYLVTYEDRWSWDMRMYLIDLRVDVRDATTNVLIGTARSFQTSLSAMGKTHQSIVQDVVSLLAKGPEVPN